jgi:hypothetical protein
VPRPRGRDDRSKSAQTTTTKKPPKTPAKGGKPELAIDSRTTVVLPSPADAPPAPKAQARNKKAPPTVATKAAPDVPATEVPEWAKRAAARTTAAAMAAVPEAAPAPPPNAAAPKGHAAKAPKPSKSAPTKPDPAIAKPGSLRAIGHAWIESIRSAGHSKSTVSSYANDLEVAYEVLDGNSAAADLTERQIATFNESKAVLKKRNGKAKARPTILKTRRALRLALVWAAQTGLIKKAPIPAKTPA